MSSCILLLGPASAGKTHLFTRPPRAGGRRRAVFIHTRPQIGVEPTPRLVVRAIDPRLAQGSASPAATRYRSTSSPARSSPRTRATSRASRSRRWSRCARSRATSGAQLFEHGWSAKVEGSASPGSSTRLLFRLLEVPFCEPRRIRRALLCGSRGASPASSRLERIGASGPLPDMDVMEVPCALDARHRSRVRRAGRAPSSTRL